MAYLGKGPGPTPYFYFFSFLRPLSQGLDDGASPLSECLDPPLVGHYWDLRKVKKGILQYQESRICTKPKNENTKGELGFLFSATIACKQAAEEHSRDAGASPTLFSTLLYSARLKRLDNKVNKKIGRN